MKTAILGLAVLACLPAIAQTNAPAGSAHPSPYNFAGVQYPRIETDGRVTFHFNATNVQKVQVSIVNVPFDMAKGDDGVWTYTTSEPQAPGYHNYWMIVDGAIVLDPNVETFIGYVAGSEHCFARRWPRRWMGLKNSRRKCAICER